MRRRLLVLTFAAAFGYLAGALLALGTLPLGVPLALVLLLCIPTGFLVGLWAYYCGRG